MNEMHSRILWTAARLFLSKGYTATSLREIAGQTDVNIGSLMHLFRTKENLLCELVEFVLNGQFRVAEKLVQGITDDKLMFWTAETILQLYMAESSETIRELYAAAYSMPNTSAVIYHTIAEKLQMFFGDRFPEYEIKDFYELEIASGSIIRGFMVVPCDMYFTMERKVKRYIETSFRVYRVEEERIGQAIDFVSQFDFKTIAQQTIDDMLTFLASSV